MKWIDRLVSIKRGEWKAELCHTFTRGLCLDLGSYNRLHEKDFIGEYIALDVERWQKAPDVIADALYLPFKSNVFDTVAALDLLEHVSKPSLLVKEAYRILKQKGIFLVTTPNAFSPGSWWDFTHRSHFTRRQLVRMFENIFPKVEIYGTGHPTLKLKVLRDLANILRYVDTYIIVATKD